jgi:hypothetical protein
MRFADGFGCDQHMWRFVACGARTIASIVRALRSSEVGVPNGVPNCQQVRSTQRHSEQLKHLCAPQTCLQIGHF